MGTDSYLMTTKGYALRLRVDTEGSDCGGSLLSLVLRGSEDVGAETSMTTGSQLGRRLGTTTSRVESRIDPVEW